MLTSPNGRPAPVTLQTIADRVGVSRTTVSNAYGRPDQLNPALRERILAVAKEVGYPGPNPTARSLRRGRCNAIGVLFTDDPAYALSYAFTDPAAVLLLQGIAAAAGKDGTGLLILPAPPEREAAATAIRQAVVDAFVVYSVRDDDPALHAILERRLPLVIVDAPRRAGIPFVGIDDRAGARAVAAHLLALGHRRIAVLTERLGPDRRSGPADLERQRASQDGTQRDRLAGYADAVRDAGLRWEDISVQECRMNTPEAGCTGAAGVLDRNPRPTAILAITDQLALGALWAARQRGVRVPEALSVAGFDDLPAAAAAAPPLTTVRQPLLEKGHAAGLLVLTPPDPGGTAPEVILPTELVVRASTGPVPT
jgi:DNA-binding LacI/PurR family transcriptional regulator